MIVTLAAPVCPDLVHVGEVLAKVVRCVLLGDPRLGLGDVAALAVRGVSLAALLG